MHADQFQSLARDFGNLPQRHNITRTCDRACQLESTPLLRTLWTKVAEQFDNLQVRFGLEESDSSGEKLTAAFREHSRMKLYLSFLETAVDHSLETNANSKSALKTLDEAFPDSYATIRLPNSIEVVTSSPILQTRLPEFAAHLETLDRSKLIQIMLGDYGENFPEEAAEYAVDYNKMTLEEIKENVLSHTTEYLSDLFLQSRFSKMQSVIDRSLELFGIKSYYGVISDYADMLEEADGLYVKQGIDLEVDWENYPGRLNKVLDLVAVSNETRSDWEDFAIVIDSGTLTSSIYRTEPYSFVESQLLATHVEDPHADLKDFFVSLSDLNDYLMGRENADRELMESILEDNLAETDFPGIRQRVSILTQMVSRLEEGW